MSTNVKEKTSSGFEQKIAELQSIVGKLEADPDVTLEESMKLFEDGLALTKSCVDELDAMQARINALNKQLDIILRRSASGECDE